MSESQIKINMSLQGAEEIGKKLDAINCKLEIFQKGSYTKLAAQIALVGQAFQQVSAVANMLVQPILAIANAYATQEVAENRLMAIMKAHGVGTKELHDIYKDYAEEMRQKTDFDDAMFLEAEKLLTLAGVMPSQMKPALETIAAFASAGYDLEKSTQAVALALNGQSRGLGKMIPGQRALPRLGMVDNHC